MGNAIGTLAAGTKCLTPAGIINENCFICGTPITIAAIAGHTCHTGAPDYDTCIYNTVQIGAQCWMQENMNIGTMINGANGGSNGDGNMTDNHIMEKYCTNNDYTNCTIYGGLYQWDEAMQYITTESARGICPAGWHIPSDAEQNTLDQYLTDPPNTCDANRTDYDCLHAGAKLKKEGGTSHFNAVFPGIRTLNGSFYGEIYYTTFISSSLNGPLPYLRQLYVTPNVYRGTSQRGYGNSVRCIEDN